MLITIAEDYILPLSHDEVVHLKCSMVNKMPGYKVDKYANLRVGYTYMFGHSGKKLLFMGQEFGQEREWSEARELDWFLLQNELNQGLQDYVAGAVRSFIENIPVCMRSTTAGTVLSGSMRMMQIAALTALFVKPMEKRQRDCFLY